MRNVIAAFMILAIACLVCAETPAAASVDTLVTQGKQAHEAGDFKKAVALLREAIALDPGDKRIWKAYNAAYQADAATRYMATLTGKYNAITLDEYRDRKKANPGLVLIDLRAAKDFEEDHIDDALNIPLEEIRFRLSELPELKIHEIVVYCVAGPRSATGQMYLSMLGYTNVKYLQGGFRRYEDVLEMEEEGETVEGIRH